MQCIVVNGKNNLKEEIRIIIIIIINTLLIIINMKLGVHNPK